MLGEGEGEEVDVDEDEDDSRKILLFLFATLDKTSLDPPLVSLVTVTPALTCH